MKTINYDFRMAHPQLFNRWDRNCMEIPVYYLDTVQCVTAMDALGQFNLNLPKYLATGVESGEIYVQPEWEEPDARLFEDSTHVPIKIIALRLLDILSED